MLKPLGDRVIIEVAQEEETTVGGIVLASSAKEKPQTGTVVAVGEGRLLENGEKILLETQQKVTIQRTVDIYKQYRKELGLTQSELGKRAGISQPNITRFESGNYNPSLEFLVKIAGAMGKKGKVTLED